MIITNVYVELSKRQDTKIMATTSITLEGGVKIHDIKVIQGKERLFIAMPSRRGEGDRYVDIVELNADARKIVDEAVFAEYDKKLAARQAREQQSQD